MSSDSLTATDSNRADLTETTLESQVMYRGQILNLRVDTVRLPSGRTSAREVAEHPDSVCIVPIDENGNVVMVRQFRTPTDGVLLELPAGKVESGEVSEETVQRELQEETGYCAANLRRLAGFWPAPGWCSQYMYAYLATGLTPSKLAGDYDENIAVQRVPLDQSLELIDAGGINDAKSIAGLLLAMRVLRDDQTRCAAGSRAAEPKGGPGVGPDKPESKENHEERYRTVSDDSLTQTDSTGADLTETTLESQVMYRGRILNLRVDTVQLPSGRIAAREVAEHSDSVCIVPIDGDGNVVMVRQFRTPTGGALLELPAGGVEAGEVSEETVQRELQEETGYRAANLQRLAGFWLAPGWCDEYMHAYLATGLTPSKLSGDDDENIAVERVSLDQSLELIAGGTINDAKSIAALLLATRVLRDN